MDGNEWDAQCVLEAGMCGLNCDTNVPTVDLQELAKFVATHAGLPDIDPAAVQRDATALLKGDYPITFNTSSVSSDYSQSQCYQSAAPIMKDLVHFMFGNIPNMPVYLVAYRLFDTASNFQNTIFAATLPLTAIDSYDVVQSVYDLMAELVVGNKQGKWEGVLSMIKDLVSDHQWLVIAMSRMQWWTRLPYPSTVIADIKAQGTLLESFSENAMAFISAGSCGAHPGVLNDKELTILASPFYESAKQTIGEEEVARVSLNDIKIHVKKMFSPSFANTKDFSGLLTNHSTASSLASRTGRRRGCVADFVTSFIDFICTLFTIFDVTEAATRPAVQAAVNAEGFTAPALNGFFTALSAIKEADGAGKILPIFDFLVQLNAGLSIAGVVHAVGHSLSFWDEAKFVISAALAVASWLASAGAAFAISIANLVWALVADIEDLYDLSADNCF